MTITYTNLPHPKDMTDGEAWAEYRSYDEEATELLKECNAAVLADRPDLPAHFNLEKACLAGALFKEKPLIQRRNLLSRWFEFYEGDEQYNKAFGYPEGHPNASE